MTRGDSPLAVKFYFAYTSPFSFLAMQPAFDLERSHRVAIRPIPYAVHIRAVYGDPSTRSEQMRAKLRYLYADARRFAAERGLTILAPRRIYDARTALMSALYAERQGKMRPYSALVFERFFRRELDVEDRFALEQIMREAGIDETGFAAYAEGPGPDELAACFDEGRRDGIFGVPTAVVDGELFWGNDRIAWVIKKLDRMGLRKED